MIPLLQGRLTHLEATFVRAINFKIGREHSSPLVVVGVIIVQSGGIGWEASVVVHNIERVGAGRKVTLCSNDDSNDVADPFNVWPRRELEYVEGLEWEGEVKDPMPIVGIEIEVGAKRHDVRERLGS